MEGYEVQEGCQKAVPGNAMVCGGVKFSSCIGTEIIRVIIWKLLCKKDEPIVSYSIFISVRLNIERHNIQLLW